MPVEPPIAEPEEPSTDEPSVKDSHEVSPVPPPGFRPFEWPQAEWINNGEVNRDPGLKFVASWSAKIAEEEMSSPPPLEPLSPIPIENSQDSITVQVGTTDSEAYTPIVLDRIRSVHRRRSRRPMKIHSTHEKPAPVEDFLFRDILCEEAQIEKRSVSIPTGNRDRGTCLDGGWPEKDPSRTNVLRPLFASWGKDARSDIRHTVWRTTLDRRAGLVFR